MQTKFPGQEFKKYSEKTCHLYILDFDQYIHAQKGNLDLSKQANGANFLPFYHLKRI